MIFKLQVSGSLNQNNLKQIKTSLYENLQPATQPPPSAVVLPVNTKLEASDVKSEGKN